MEKYFERPFESHEHLNKWQVYGGNRVSTYAGSMSVYVSEVKLRKFLKRLTDEEIEELFDKEMTAPGIERHRYKLLKKLENLLPWQLFRAVGLLYEISSYKAFEFILLCNKKDDNLEQHEERIKNNYSAQ